MKQQTIESIAHENKTIKRQEEITYIQVRPSLYLLYVFEEAIDLITRKERQLSPNYVIVPKL